MLPAFREYALAGGESLYFERDFHMNATGHELSGELLMDFVARTYLEDSE